jgi:Zn finger protein HypA/HybF involved in hydrogenase expression
LQNLAACLRVRFSAFKEKMNTKSKTLIGFDEITAFHFRCKTCSLEMTIPVREDFTRTRTAHKCPSCGDSWLVVNDGSAAPALANFVQAINAISQWPGQCGISVEIAAAP